MTNKTQIYRPIAPDIEELASEHHHDREAALELLCILLKPLLVPGVLAGYHVRVRVLDHHLKSQEFFSAKEFPKIAGRLESVYNVSPRRSSVDARSLADCSGSRCSTTTRRADRTAGSIQPPSGG